MIRDVKLKHTYKIKFKNINNNSIEKIDLDNIDNKTEAYDKARKKLLNKYNQSIQKFESDWKLDECKHFIDFKNKPWDTISELESDLENISGIRKAMNYPKGMEYYGPIVLRATIDSSYDANNIKQEILSYFKGLQVEIGSNGIDLYVTINPFDFK